MLNDDRVCAQPGTCATADSSPIAVNWSYSVGHWVEESFVGEGDSFGSAGAFGFYPWADSTKIYFGVVARYDTNSGAGSELSECGFRIRRAFITGVAQ